MQSAIEQSLAKVDVLDETKLALRGHFEPFEKQAEQWGKELALIVVKDENDTHSMEKAETARKNFQATRLGVDKLHKSLKEDSLRRGQVLDAIKRGLNGLIEPLEEEASKKANYAKEKEKERIEAAQIARIELLAPYRFEGDNIEKLSLGDMNQAAFDNFLMSMKAGHEQREAEKAELERVRIENEQKAIAERKAIQEENERLRKQNAEIEAKAAAEREANRKIAEAKAEEDKIRNKRIALLMSMGFFVSMEYNSFIRGPKDKHAMNVGISELDRFTDEEFKAITDKFRSLIDEDIKADQAEQDRITAIARAEKEKLEKKLAAETAERKRLEQEQANRDALIEQQKRDEYNAKRRATRAPDRTKLLSLAEAIELIAQPSVKDEEAQQILDNATSMLAKVVTYIKTNAEKL